jgi:error-prone DNA polymerase
VGEFEPTAPDESAAHRRDGGFAVRLGLAGIRGIGRTAAERIVAARAGGPYTSLEDLVRRTGLETAQLEALATADTFASLGLDRRQALWQAGRAARNGPDTLPGTTPDAQTAAVQPPLFETPTSLEVLAADLRATGVSTTDHQLAHLRAWLDGRGVLPCAGLKTAEAGRRIWVAGLVTHRQRPGTASGITFLNLEDETGHANVVCSAGLWQRYRRVLREARGLVVRGRLERSPEGVANLLADQVEPLPVGGPHTSRDFR